MERGAVLVALWGVVACRAEPPEVVIAGPDEVLAGQEASFSVILTPPTEATVSWSAARSFGGPGACGVSADDSAKGRVLIRVDPECEEGQVVVSARVRAAGATITARKTVRIRPVEAPVWPEPLPDTWRVLNDYQEAGEPRLNRFGGAYGTWGFRGGKCRIAVSDGVLQVTYALPMGDSECGTFEYLKGAVGKPEPFDIRAFERVALLLKSGDGKLHRVVLEVVELDPYAQALQGYVGESPVFVAGPDWKRYEVRLDDILHPRFDRRMGKQVGLRVRRKDQDQASGVVLVDNLTLIEKGAGR